MSRRILLALAVVLPLPWAAGATAGKVKPPAVDPDRIINDSFSFLKAREPEMTPDEFALYERVIPMARDRPEFALKLLETMVTDEKEESAAFEFALANVYYMHDRHDMAEVHFRKAIDRYPEFQRAWNNLGTLYYVTSRFEEAVDCYGKAIALGDRDAQTLGLLGYALYKTGNPLAAEMAYMQAMASDPKNPDWIGAVMNLLLENKEYTRAEPLGRRLVALRPKEAASWNLHAGILAALGRQTDACAGLELAASLHVIDADGLALLGDLYFEQRLMDDAERVYGKLMRVAPSVATSRMLAYIQSMLSEGNAAEATRLLGGLLVPDGGDDRVRYFVVRAQSRMASADTPGTRADLLEILKIDPLHGWALVTLAESYKAAGDDSRAEFYYTEATRVPEFAYAAHLELANVHLRSRRYPACITHLEAALSLDSSPELQRHLAQVRLLLDAP